MQLVFFRRHASLCGLLISLATLISMSKADTAIRYLKIPGYECLPDLMNANACAGLGQACCLADNPCKTYCDGFNSPSTCSRNPDLTCRLAQNVPCGTQINCADTPVLDPNGNPVKCGGAPDKCGP